MSITNSFTSGTTISSSAVNANFTDVASEITGSLPRDGQAAMTGQFKASNGSAAAPSISFSSDTNTGLYRKASDTLAVVAGGTEMMEITGTTITLSGTFSFGGFGNGTVSLPSISFSSDPDSGLYRIGANNIGVAVNGAKVVDVATTGVAVTGTLSSSGAMTVTSGGLTVTAGGATVTAGGLTVTDGGLTVTAGTVSLPSGAYATQAEQETGTSTTKLVTPGRQHFHPGHPKAWGRVTISGGTSTLGENYNVASAGNPSGASVSVTFTTALSTGAYAVLCTIGGGNLRFVRISSQSTTGFTATFADSGGSAATPESFAFAIFGDI